MRRLLSEHVLNNKNMEVYYMSEIKKTETELAVTSGFVSTEGMDILREALADDCQGMDFFLR